MKAAAFLFVSALLLPSFAPVGGATEDRQDPPDRPQIDEAKVALPPVNEPEWPPAGDESEAARRDCVPIQGGGYQFQKKFQDGTAGSGVVVPGHIMMNQGLIELLGCGEGGKEHESLLRVDGDLQALDLALTLSRFKRGPVPARLPAAADVAQGSRCIILVQWKDDKGKVVTRRAEDLVIDVHRGRTMRRVGWTYVASLADVEDPAAAGQKKTQRVLAATATKSLMTISWNNGVREGATLFDNPLPDALDDTSYIANYTVLPPGGTPVRLIVRTPMKAEAEEIAALEKEPK